MNGELPQSAQEKQRIQQEDNPIRCRAVFLFFAVYRLKSDIWNNIG